MGDRFGHQGRAQLRAVQEAAARGIHATPVWNKSNREHAIIGTRPEDVRAEADAAVAAAGWAGAYFVDADHIGLSSVDAFLAASDFFTLDVADFIGRPAPAAELEAFERRHERYLGRMAIPGIEAVYEVDRAGLRRMAATYLGGVREAGRIYRHIAEARGAETFVAEVSMDETAAPQSPVELFFILAAIADEGIPAQTIAPKFTGRFNKGVDYVGDAACFAREFEADLAVIAHAVREFDLPENLKLSVHSGSDKFSIYGSMRDALAARGAGLHLKTAGTTWLEELIGLASVGGAGLALAVEVYGRAVGRFDELCGPYAAVIDIDPGRLPRPDAVADWTGEQFVRAVRHDPSCADFNGHMRQLLHVGYKVAAELGRRYLDALEEYEEAIAEQVTANLLERHLARVFPAVA